MMAVRASAVILLICSTACDTIDPYRREGVWRPADVNAANLVSMVVVPSDLAVAMPLAPADGALAAAAAGRLRRDHVRPLLDSGLAHVVPVNGGAAAQSAAGQPMGNGE